MRPWLCALVLAGCFPARYIEPDVGAAGPVPSPERGRQVLLNRSYLQVGVPVVLVDAIKVPRLAPDDELPGLEGREGINRLIPNGYSGRWLAGVPSVAENCLLCHAGPLRGAWVMGLGNSFIDTAVPLDSSLVDDEKLKGLAPTPEELAVLDGWLGYQRDLAPYSRSTQRGTVAALYFTGYFFAHRRPADFAWTAEAAYPMLATPPPETDVPAWWLLKKKKRLYYGGELQGDQVRALMQFMSPPGNTLADLRAAEADFVDVLAYLRTLEAPKFPGVVDPRLAEAGEVLFIESCETCHGSHGPGGLYSDDEVIPLEKVKTDPARNQFMHRLGFAAHYNQTWFGERSRLEATVGYVAPPLDGVWATAPYLHNGSVPTLDALLDPALRPRCFARAWDSRKYDLGEHVGWEYTVPTPCAGPEAYDTAGYGKGNGGHDYGAELTPGERRALLEYLKTL